MRLRCYCGSSIEVTDLLADCGVREFWEGSWAREVAVARAPQYLLDQIEELPGESYEDYAGRLDGFDRYHDCVPF